MKQIELETVADWIPKRDAKGYKGTYGKVLLIGGNERMGGALIMAASAALHSGAGLVTAATAPENRSALHFHAPEIMFVDMYETESLREMVKGVETILIGPGLGRDESSKEVFKTVAETVTEEQIVIFDGDGISLYTEFDLPRIPAQLIFTPHLGEWQTLSGMSPDEENTEENEKKQQEIGAVIVLKKDRTQVYFERDVWENTAGNPAMATGGMGDTLAGMITGFSKQFESLEQAVLSAVYIHSHIGDQLAEEYYVTLPTKIIERIPRTLRELEQK